MATSDPKAAPSGLKAVDPGRKGDDRPSVRPGGAAALLGTVLSGRYRIEKLLGEGGMGAVYQAQHTHMRKRLAVKILHPEMSRLPEVVARFEREAMAAAHIDHPNVATATDFGKLEDGSFFLVLEYVEGQSLRDALAKGPLDLGRALRVMRQIAAALQRAHAIGIVHRDLKPENIMLIERDGEPDFVKVLDFGIAKVPVGQLSALNDDEKNKHGSGGTALTQLGMVYGTPEYMAPEQALGQSVTPAADIYALGIMTFEMLTGMRPFDHESKVTLLGMHVTAPVPTIASKAPGVYVPPEVEAVIRRMLAKESVQRFADAKELIDAVDTIWTPAYGSLPGSPASAMSPRGSMASLSGLQAGSVPGTAAALQPPAVPPARGSLRDLLASTGSLPAFQSSAHRVVDRVSSLVRKSPKNALYAAIGAAGLVVVIVIVVTVAALHKRAAGDEANAAADAGQVAVGEGNVTDPVASTVTAAPVDPDVDAQVAAAVASIDKGDYATGIDKLVQLEKAHPQRADIHRSLEKAYVAQQRQADAMNEAEAWLKADASAVNDLKLDEDVRNTAVFGKEGADHAFKLLEREMGTVGIDVLYDIAWGQSGAGYPAAAQRAQRDVMRADVRERANPGLKITLDLRAASGCDAKKQLLQRAKDDGDGRTVAVLRSYASTKGCGFAGARDCYSCIHHDGLLSKTISEIEARARGQ